ncbi:hypothetical protein DNTS_003613 [Danionella cerebrum]|uniref:Uncharacterized protein n=1 Tax=Danionella cerebrum TaxID=2873325 RepID=A0A553NRK1_9TELE|nr:hypothetical protein DNTS_003613 [Danionella translucida]
MLGRELWIANGELDDGSSPLGWFQERVEPSASPGVQLHCAQVKLKPFTLEAGLLSQISFEQGGGVWEEGKFGLVDIAEMQGGNVRSANLSTFVRMQLFCNGKWCTKVNC